MRPGWTKNTLGDVVLPIESIDPTKEPAKRFRYVDVSSVSNETFEIVESSELAGKDAPSRARRKIRAGDVIFATIRPTLKRVAIVPPELDGEVCSTGYFVFRTKPFLDGRYLFYWLLTDQFFQAMERLQTGASYPAVNDTQVRQQEIVYPPLPEQQRIVAILNEAFVGLATAAAHAETNLKNARELFESALQLIFGTSGKKWSNKKLGQIAEVRSGGTPSRAQKSYWSGDLPWYSSGELNDLVTAEPLEKISRLGLEKSNAKLFPKGSLLIGMYDTAAMKMSITDRESAFNQAIAGVKPNSTLDLMFVMHALLAVKAAVLSLRRGVRQKNLSLEKIKDIEIKVPTIEIQKHVVDQLLSCRAAIVALEDAYRRKLDRIAELKQSILLKAFSGELTSPPSQAIQEAAE